MFPSKYDMIITDMTMPKMTGDEMARQIKAIRPDIPIIICSGFSDRINPQTMESIGISAVLMKPVIYADLAQTVRKVLDTDVLSLNYPCGSMPVQNPYFDSAFLVFGTDFLAGADFFVL